MYSGKISAPLLIDLDGTLVALDPSREDLERLRSDLMSVCQTVGLQLEHYGIFPMYRAVLAQQGFDSAAARLIREMLDEREVTWAGRTARTLVAGNVLETVAELRPLVLVTSNGAPCVHSLFESGRLPRVFVAQVTRDDVTDLKPSSVPITEALSRVCTSSSFADFIGDSDADRESVMAYEANRNSSLPSIRFHHVGEFENVVAGVAAANDVFQLLAQSGEIHAKSVG